MLVYAMVGLALIAACQASPPEAAPPRLDWQPCADERALQCATVVVPRDHAQPSGVTLTLSLVRAPAREPEQRTGSLVLNRGGPGYSTVEYVKLVWTGRLPNPLAPEVWARYDVIGVDQRGVGQSTPAIHCFASQAEEREFSAGLPPFPTTLDEERAPAAKDLEYARRCRELSGDLLDHVTTADAARDLDLIRAALGEERLNYLGQSYSRFDPATPLTSAMRLHTLFSNSGLLVNDGWGHIATQQSSCIVEAISAYLVEARLPDRDATCTPDRIPFM